MDYELDHKIPPGTLLHNWLVPFSALVAVTDSKGIATPGVASCLAAVFEVFGCSMLTSDCHTATACPILSCRLRCRYT